MAEFGPCVAALALSCAACSRPLAPSEASAQAPSDSGTAPANDSDVGTATTVDDGGSTGTAQADAGMSDAGNTATASDGGMPPPDVPAMIALAPPEAPARPTVGATCPSAAPPAVHHPGPCIVLEMQLVTHEVTRTTRTWENDAPAAQTTDYWSSDFPGGQYSQFIHAYLSWTSNSDGQPLRAVGIEQEIYGTSSDGATALSG